MQTPQAYELAIKQALLKKVVEVHDIFAVPDYTKILKDCGDKEFTNYAKGKDTQHQFIFEAVDVSEHFPFGVKLTYRAYSQDVVYEIVKKKSNPVDAYQTPSCPTLDCGSIVTVEECHVETYPKAFVVDGVTVPAGKAFFCYIFGSALTH